MRRIALNELPALAREVLQKIRALPESNQAIVVALKGELGAGKTTFTQIFAKELGITDAVQSPTYVLMKSYPIKWHQFRTLIHIDAYRFDSPEQFRVLRPEKFLSDPQNLILIEWPERLGKMLQSNIIVDFSHPVGKEEVRNIVIEADKTSSSNHQK